MSAYTGDAARLLLATALILALALAISAIINAWLGPPLPFAGLP